MKSNSLGCDIARREKILDYLNNEYQRVLKEKESIYETYSHLVANNPYRVLSSYTYDWQELSLRSNRVATNPALTDAGGSSNESSVSARSVCLPCPFKNISEIREHDDFIQLLINGKMTAELTNSPTSINWRGHKTTIDSKFKLDRKTLRDKLLDALKEIKLSPIERQVILILKHIIFIIYKTCFSIPQFSFSKKN